LATICAIGGVVSGLGRIATHNFDGVAALDGQGADGAGHVPRLVGISG
jgi:hypothetical protein